MLTHEEKLGRYADVIVRVGLNIQPGQELIISAEHQTQPLVVEVVKKAYDAGAGLVNVMYYDDKVSLARFEHAGDASFDMTPSWITEGITKAYEAGAARLAILGGNPALLKGQDPEKIARLAKAAAPHSKKLHELITSNHSQWCVVSYPSVEQAKMIYRSEPQTPEEEFADLADRHFPERLVMDLWEEIFKVVRVDDSVADPVSAWTTHNDRLHSWADRLNEARYESLRFVGPGTDITIGLADGHQWNAGSKPGLNGIDFNANLPTEEVFTTPHKDRVDGIISSTKPLLYRGQKIDGIVATFQNGRIINFTAKEGEESFRKLIETDEGAARLGEVALVPHSSPISQSGLVFCETLFDENASCHIAQGQAYSFCMEDGTPEEKHERGANKSDVHVDWMIGSDKISVFGIKDGEEVPVMIDGEFTW